MDPLGDHPLCCNKSGDRIKRHNRLRNLVFKLADTGPLAHELEKLGILGVTDKTRRRPGGVSIKLEFPEALPSMSPSSTLSPPLRGFKGKNFGVGSWGRREAVAHSLRDV